ncbi:hypothetical protein PMI22_03142 [Pseudomonas sp. GM21]|jgi:hypothetical protein|uniref:hypothetical protein n=1 Tax=Pseudomonas sp. GM21 TaxID=1144325 RepID=UPI0002725F4F|nr:hypothetical protein [Pseudomonas sp. GM21]EJM18679.1 hypothetical protein PMI22_03142 [Pseudomonas sp. GM21]
MPILESDWKKLKELREIALDRFCQGVLADAKTISQNGALSAHTRYRMLYRLMRDRDKVIVDTFDNNGQSRSSALMGLWLMVMHDLLTEEELSVLSETALHSIREVVRQPSEIEWLEETVRKD